MTSGSQSAIKGTSVPANLKRHENALHMYYRTMPAFFNSAMKPDIIQEPYPSPSAYVCALCAFFDAVCLSLALTLSAQDCTGIEKK